MNTRTLAAAGATIAAGLLLTACGGDSKPAATPATSVTVTAAPTTTPPVATPAATTTPAPKPTTAKPKPKPTEKNCGPNKDVIVWVKTPGVSNMAQVLGSYNASTCEPTFHWVKDTSPTDPGNCTQAAWASDNPGYNADADPAARLKKVQVSVGPAC